MKLQLIVVETGERWRRALLRMVLDPKGSSHNDYGSFQSGSSTVDNSVTIEESTLHIDESVRLSSDMTQSDIYQRQPLLPPANKTADSWTTTNGNSLHIPESEYYDSDDKNDELAINRNGNLVNGDVVKIDLPTPSRDEPRFPKEKWKTLMAFLILAVNFILTTASLALVHERVPDREKHGPLPDIVIDNIKPVNWALDVSEILIMILTNITSLVLIFHKHRYIVMRRVFLLLSLLYLMRSVTMYVTVLPVASTTYYCSPKLNSTGGLVVAKRVWQLISGFGLSINGQHTFCGDYIYSGHTVILVMCYLIIAEYTPKCCFPLHWLVWVTSVTGIIMILIAHGHYTVDVIIAYYVTTTLFWVYHTMANNNNLKHHGSHNFLARMWWFRAFQYFEKNVGGPVPRQYEWPLPWPRRFHVKHPNRNS